MFDLADLNIAQSTRGYDPMEVSHYQAPWVAGQTGRKPTWPIVQGDNLFDTQRLRRYLEYEQLLGKKGNEVLDRQWVDRNCIEPWRKLAAKGVGVLVGESGAFNKTPHDVVLAWARDLLGLWKEAGWGWALWNFRGPFGILDSQRSDVAYEDFRGHKLDRRMLTLLQ